MAGWKFTADAPIYLQIVEKMKQMIVWGRYKCGEQLPTVRELAAEAGVNPNTVQRALSELENTGLVHANRTSGRFITEDESLVAEVKSHIALKETMEFVAKMNQLGLGKNEIVKLINGSEDNDNEKNN